MNRLRAKERANMAIAVNQSSIQDVLETLHKAGVRSRYENYIGGKWVPPTTGRYFVSQSPINAEPICEFARSGPADVEKALDAAHAVREKWGHTSPADRATILLKIADVVEQNLETLALAETLDNGKPIRETRAADMPLTVDHFRYFAACLRAEEGALNVVTGPGGEIGKALASNKRLAKIAFTGETTTGRLIMQYASEPIIPQTLELGGKSPNIFFADVMDEDDDFLDKALEGFALFALNKGEVCTCPSRALIQESIYDKFMERAVARVKKIKVANPLDPTSMMGPQVSKEQIGKILDYIRIGKEEGAQCLTGGERAHLGGDLEEGNFMEPTVFAGNNKMRVFQEEIFGPVVSVTKFKTLEEAIEIGNDTPYGLGSGVWSRNVHNLHRVGREIKAGRCWTNCYHLYPAGAAFGGYKESGFGLETHKMILDHYQQTKNLLVSYSPKKFGFF